LKLTLDEDGGIIAKGTSGSGTLLSTTGAGTRMIWYPRKSAIRAGCVGDSQWDEMNIGEGSAGMGINTTASGSGSTALGSGTTASGVNATSMGGSTNAVGGNSTALGYATTAGAWASVAIGQFNVGGGTPGSWIYSDPLFEIGIGTSGMEKANAITVLKNGNIGIKDPTPEYLLDMETDGAGGGYYSASDHSWHNGSSRLLKQDISPNDMDVRKILENVQIVKYRFKTEAAESSEAPYHIGFIAEDAPALLSGRDRNSMATGDCIGLLLAVVKEQQKEIETLKLEIAGLKK